MPGRLLLVLGGARSGKSAFAQSWCEARPGARVFIATALALDDEMRARIDRHRADRRGRGWTMVEEPHAVAAALAATPSGATVLIDCLTLWLAARIDADGNLDEDAAAAEAGAIVAAARARAGATMIVSNEIGLGVVPGDALSRAFVDAIGRIHRAVAAAADDVVLLAAGLPLPLKRAGVALHHPPCAP
jgi:adenosylcobinamide kinase/adenosylcobinamide-phosphate guanylyltransferase